MNKTISPSTAASVENRVYDIEKAMTSAGSFIMTLSETLK